MQYCGIQSVLKLVDISLSSVSYACKGISLGDAYGFPGRLGGGVAQKAVAAGLRCIVSNQDKWYLDHLDASWQDFYTNEPLTNITNPKQQRLVIGGEVCMWGERIDASDIEQTIWPRAAAAAGTCIDLVVLIVGNSIIFLKLFTYFCLFLVMS